MDGAGLAPGVPLRKLTAWSKGTSACAPQCASGAKHCRGGRTALVLCFKGAPDKTGLMREEIETEITRNCLKSWNA